MRKTAACLSLLLLTSGCSGGAGDAANCLPVSADRAAAILGSDGGLTVDQAAAVKSAEHENAYYVAIKFSGPGLGHEVGIWAMHNLDSGGPVYSVDGAAEQFSGLPKMGGFAVTDSGARAAKSCVS